MNQGLVQIESTDAARPRSHPGIPFHPLADIFPLIEGQEFDDLVRDIARHGLREPIILLNGQILDGRNRYRASVAAKLLPESLDHVTTTQIKHFKYFVPMGAPDPSHDELLAFVLSKNLHRRQLDESQRAAVAANLASMRQGERTDVEPSAKLQKVAQGVAAERLNVSTRLVADAVKVKRAAPEVFRAVEQGRIPASSAAKLLVLPPEEQKRVIEAHEPARTARNEIARHNRDERLEEIAKGEAGAEPTLSTTEKFSLIYADPPWRFDVWSEETGLEKCPDRHYPTMSIEEICELPVGDIVAETALLFLWITVPRLMRAADIFRAWGRVIDIDPEYGVIRQPWTYVSNYAWDKANFGPGRWNRNCHEHLLIARIGDVPAPLPADRERSLHREAATEHSAKPDYFAALIEGQYPQLQKIELFRRGPARPGWAAWGNQATGAAA